MAEIHHTGHNPPPTGLSRLAAAILVVLIVCGFYWKLLLTNQFTWLSGDDTTSQVLPWLQFQASEWHAGRVPLWDPNLWLGQSLIGQAQPGVAYPLNWLLFAMPLRDGFIKTGFLNWYFVVIHLMGAWFAYLLARDLGVRRASAVFAGCAYTLLGWMGETEWPQMLNGAVWAPLVLMYVFRACRGASIWTSAVFGGVFLGMSWLSGHHQAPIFLSLACGSIFLWNGIRNRRLIAVAAVFFLVAVCAGAVQILPAYEYGKNSVRWVGAPDPIGWGTKVPWTVHREFGARPADVLGIVFPGMHTHSSPYMGVATLALALVGVWLWRRKREARWLAALGAGSLIYALAENSPLEGLLYSLVPLVEKARNPSAAFYLMGLAGAVLAAMALDRLFRDPAAVSKVSRWLVWLAAGIFALRAGWALTQQFGELKEDRILVTALCALALALVMILARKRRITLTAAALCATLVMVTEASNENSFLMPAYSEKDRVAQLTALSEHGDIAEFLRRQPGKPRVEINRSLIGYNFGDWHGIHTSAGYLASLSTSVVATGLNSPSENRLLGVAFAVNDKPTSIHTQDVFTGKAGLKVFVDPEARPRVFAVHELLPWLPRHDAMAMNDYYADRLTQATFVTGPAPKLESCTGLSRARLVLHNPSKVQIQAEMGCRGMVILTDAYFPGWKATVDGAEAQIYEVYGGLRGIVVGEGKHDVVMVYRPASILAGGALTLTAWLLAGLLCVFRLRNRRAKRAEVNIDD
jgi:hypothetical protein